MVMGLGSRGVPRPLPQYGGLGALPPPKKIGTTTFKSVNFGAAYSDNYQE